MSKLHMFVHMINSIFAKLKYVQIIVLEILPLLKAPIKEMIQVNPDGHKRMGHMTQL